CLTRSSDCIYSVRIEADFVASPRRGMPGKADFQRDTAIVRATRLCDLGAVLADRGLTLITWSDDCNMAGLVVVVILVCRNHQPTLVRVPLRFSRGSDRLPTALRTVLFEPVVLRVGQQHLRMLGWSQNVYAERACGCGYKSAAMCVFSRR